MPNRKSLKRSEWLLFLAPVLMLGAAFMARPIRQTMFPIPSPKPVPTPTPTPVPNLYSHVSNTTIGRIMVSPDGKTIHIGHQEPQAKFSTWNEKTGTLIRRFGNFQQGGSDVLFSPNGKIIGFVYGGWKGDRLVLFDSATGKEKLQIKKTGMFQPVALNNEVVAMATKDDMRLYNIGDGHYIGKLRHRVSKFFPESPQFSPDGRLLLWKGVTGHDSAAYANGTVSDELVWFDWKKKKLIHAIKFPQTDLFKARFSGDGKVILAIGFRRYWVKGAAKNNRVEATPKLFAVDVRTGKQLYSKSIIDWPNDFAVSPNGKWFDCPTFDKEYSSSIYEVRSGREVQRFTWAPQATCWSSDSQTFYYEAGIVKRLRLQRDGRWKGDKDQK